jgi:trehalose-6-phosphate synthase
MTDASSSSPSASIEFGEGSLGLGAKAFCVGGTAELKQRRVLILSRRTPVSVGRDASGRLTVGSHPKGGLSYYKREAARACGQIVWVGMPSFQRERFTDASPSSSSPSSSSPSSPVCSPQVGERKAHMPHQQASQAAEPQPTSPAAAAEENSNLNALEREEVTGLLRAQGVEPVWVDATQRRGYYEGACKQVLWTVVHYLTSYHFDAEAWACYEHVNRLFAETVARLYRPGDLIWVHDYHLLLVGAFLREQPSTAKARVGFFLHSPFPTSEIFRCLPVRAQILEALLQCDVVGFQTYDYARHFLTCCQRLLPAYLQVETSPGGVRCRNRQVSVRIVPIGVDADRFEPRSEVVQARVTALREQFAGLRIILGKDSLEVVKGVPLKLQAFARFLTNHPEWVRRVVLVQLGFPPESDDHDLAALEDYRAVAAEISGLVSEINGRFGSVDYQPVHYLPRHVGLTELTALYTAADVALITPLRDGMNLTSQEYVVCQAEQWGALILSEFTGSARCLSGAFLVNPYNTVKTAEVIHTALTMPAADLALKAKQNLTFVRGHSARSWGAAFLGELAQPRVLQPVVPELDRQALCSCFRAAASAADTAKRLLLLDYDGTLAPIVSVPSMAAPTESLIDILTALAACPQNRVVVISGRDRDSLGSWLGDVPNLELCAEHGNYYCPPNTHQWEETFADLDLSWRPRVEAALHLFTERTPGSFIEFKRRITHWCLAILSLSLSLFVSVRCMYVLVCRLCSCGCVSPISPFMHE